MNFLTFILSACLPHHPKLQKTRTSAPTEKAHNNGGISMTTVFLLPAESFYWLGLQPLLQAQLHMYTDTLQISDTHQCRHKNTKACRHVQVDTYY